MKLYSYFRSSAAYRVRIALNLKNIEHELIPVNLLKSEQQGDDYVGKNPQGLLPALETEQGVLAQSLAILEWLEETQPNTPVLLPADPWQKAQVRNLCYAIACDIHPIDNLRILKYLSSELGADDDTKNTWYRHWIEVGFAKIETMLGNGPFCFGDAPTLADLCLVPQIFNAHRFKVDMSQFPKIEAIYQHCNTIQAFIDAAPENQIDAA